MPASITLRCKCDKCDKIATYVLTHRDSTSYKCACKCHK